MRAAARRRPDDQGRATDVVAAARPELGHRTGHRAVDESVRRQGERGRVGAQLSRQRDERVMGGGAVEP